MNNPLRTGLVLGSAAITIASAIPAQGRASLTPDGKWFAVSGMTADAGAQTVSGVDWGIGLAAYSTS